jgi:hypothetical protein
MRSDRVFAIALLLRIVLGSFLNRLLFTPTVLVPFFWRQEFWYIEP